ncbi:MAG: hypothetical protein J7L82_01345 [Staphylothermus sp.]|nr:hypothetical protein [Staphylothermus sp.]
MIQRKLVDYIAEEQRQAIDKELLKELKKLANKHSIQYALLWYIYLAKEATFKELYKIYRYISDKLVRENTVRKQLQQLKRKGLIKKLGDSYIALVDPREVSDLFDIERSKSGKIGATIRHLRIASKPLKIGPGLSHYTKQIVEKARELVRKGKKAVALDLLVHTLLPLRENEVLWLWHRDIFIYYIRKTKAGKFRAIRSKEIANLLKKLGYTEGIMILHTLGHEESRKIIHKIFSRGSYSWPWARSVSYGLKQLGLLQELETLYKIQLKNLDNKIELILWNLCTKEQLCKYEITWNYELPEPLKNRNYIIATVLGKQHVRREIEIDSYINSKWRR